ncbi:MAG: M28 family peptidase [Candidatus Cloacimonetes bacterium]|nr:M28 family peptidase [Candidatus Cloacimonadota bacterium]
MFRLMIIILVVFTISACGSKVPVFDQENAFEILQQQCDLGPRYPGSAEIELCRDLIINKLSSTSALVEEQPFETTQLDSVMQGVNIIARFYPRLSRRILLAAHYDTRPWADKEEDPSLHKQPISGANDAASGVAVLLELGRIFDQYPPQQFGIDLVFFDLEDMGRYNNNETWCLGSTYFAENYKDEFPEKAIVVDMIGDADLVIDMEYLSYHNSPLLVKEVWETAQDLGFSEFQTRITKRIYDDHVPLLKAGFKAIVIIDFEYPYWHTLEDTPDKCSPSSLYVVGQTLLELIYQEK